MPEPLMITDTDGRHAVGILRESGSEQVLLTIALTLNPGTVIVQVDAVFPNTRAASATLRDTLGLGPAVDLLDKHGVPRTDPMFDLNHSGLWDIGSPHEPR